VGQRTRRFSGDLWEKRARRSGHEVDRQGVGQRPEGTRRRARWLGDSVGDAKCARRVPGAASEGELWADRGAAVIVEAPPASSDGGEEGVHEVSGGARAKAWGGTGAMG
jgi:hypothetical protein